MWLDVGGKIGKSRRPVRFLTWATNNISLTETVNGRCQRQEWGADSPPPPIFEFIYVRSLLIHLNSIGKNDGMSCLINLQTYILMPTVGTVLGLGETVNKTEGA